MLASSSHISSAHLNIGLESEQGDLSLRSMTATGPTSTSTKAGRHPSPEDEDPEPLGWANRDLRSPGSTQPEHVNEDYGLDDLPTESDSSSELECKSQQM